ncbi:MAG: hypothetical protein P4L83_01990 [Nevskia sp.]|nr:hypothetical protein [Nevskia sp.]
MPVLSALVGFDSNDTAVLRRALTSLVTTPIEFNLLEDGNSKERQYRVTGMISRGEIRKGVCT